MKKKLLLFRLFALVAALSCALGTHAYDFKYNGMYYNIKNSTNKTVELTYGNSTDNTYRGSVSIPSTVPYGGNTYTVVEIDEQAFDQCSGLTSVSIPLTVTDIDNWAFRGCTGLRSLTLPNSLKIIGVGSFVNCTGLTSLIIPNSVIFIGIEAFMDCTGLTSVTIGSSVATIANFSFLGCTNLRNVTCLASTPPKISYSDDIEDLFLCENSTYNNGTLKVPRGCKSAYQSADGWKNFSIIQERTYDFVVNGFYYFITGDNTVEVSYNSGYNSYSGGVTIPSSVTYDGTTYQVTAIGASAFRECSNLTSVSIPGSVTSVSAYAFYDCSRLTSVDLPNSVTTIGNYAFDSCSSLTSVSLGTSMANIGYEAFGSCSNLRSVTCRALAPPTLYNSFVFHSNTYRDGILYVPNFGKSAYREADGWSKFMDIRGTGNYNFVSDNIFYVFTGDNTVDVTYFNTSYNTYSGDVVVPESVTYNGTTYQVTAIGACAFRASTGLTSVTLPNSITAIDAEAFYGCTSLEVVTVPNSVVNIGPRAFYDCNQVERLILGSSVFRIGAEAFKECEDLTYVGCLANRPPSMSLPNVFDDDTYSYASLGVPKGCKSAYQNAYWWMNFEVIDELVFDFVVNGIYYTITGTNRVEVATAAGNTYSGGVVIPSTVTYGGTTYQVNGIGMAAFGMCTGLTSVTIPTSVNYIDAYSFVESPALTSIDIPSSVTSIGMRAFDKCTGLTSVKIGKGLRSIGDDAFRFCEALMDVTCLAATPPALADDDVFEDVTYSNGTLTVLSSYLGDYKAADGWKNFTHIVAQKCYDFVKNGIYYNITGENTVEVTYRDEEYNSYSGSIGIFETVTYNGVTYNVTAIGDRAFKYCWNLGQVNFIEDGVTAIGEEAFNSCSLTELAFPSTVTTIGSRAFADCSELTELSLGNSVTYIGDGAFTWCTDLSSLTLPNTVTYLGAGAFNCCFDLSRVNIPEKVTTIGEWTFADCYALTSLDIPNLVTSIGDYAFSTSALVSITLPKNLQRIGEYAFADCEDLTSVTCLATTPPAVRSTTFDDSHYTTVTLTVPKDYRSAYNAANYWKNFTSINELPGLDEALNVAGGHIRFTSEGSYPWEVTAGGGRIYAISGNAGVHSSTSTLTTTVTLSRDGSVTFAYKAWGEGPSYDVCVFSVDGNQKFSYSNKQNDWVNYTVQLTAGTHTLTWKYSKDYSVNPPGDYFAVDNVVVTGLAVSGDVDGDGHISIADVADLIDLILSGEASIEVYPTADVDGDGRITIADASDLIDMLLGN